MNKKLKSLRTFKLFPIMILFVFFRTKCKHVLVMLSNTCLQYLDVENEKCLLRGFKVKSPVDPNDA